MKVLLLVCFFALGRGEEQEQKVPVVVAPSYDSNGTLAQKLEGYHMKIGVPEAERVRISELVGSRIANGLASYNGEHPYMAGLLVTLTTGQTSLCGGTLLNNRRVVTAASCWYDGYSQGYSIQVVLGSVYLFSGGTRVQVPTIYNHPLFNPYSSANDIAVLVIPYVAYTSYIKPLVLPYGSYLSRDFSGSTAEAIGYGKRTEASSITTSQTLRDVFLSVISNVQCQSYFGAYVTPGHICTSGANGKGPCGGDMGGPLILRRYDGVNDMLIGVISFGSASGCQAGHPTVYSRVTYHNSWVRSLL